MLRVGRGLGVGLLGGLRKRAWSGLSRFFLRARPFHACVGRQGLEGLDASCSSWLHTAPWLGPARAVLLEREGSKQARFPGSSAPVDGASLEGAGECRVLQQGQGRALNAMTA